MDVILWMVLLLNLCHQVGSTLPSDGELGDANNGLRNSIQDAPSNSNTTVKADSHSLHVRDLNNEEVSVEICSNIKVVASAKTSDGEPDYPDDQASAKFLDEPQDDEMLLQSSKDDPCRCSDAPVRARSLKDTGKIVGGEEADMHEFPWMVGICKGSRKKPFCGGALINDKYVLTAAHCMVMEAKSITVVLGEHDTSRDNEAKSSRVPVASYVKHKSYNKANFDNDIALMKLKYTVTFNAEIAPICLATTGMDYEGEHGTVAGWGKTQEGGSSSAVLRKVDVPIMPVEKCKGNRRKLNTIICAYWQEGGKDSCQGDSGGPLMLPVDGVWQLIGVVSWGQGCARRNARAGYTRVDKYLNWIATGVIGAKTCTR